MFFYTLYGLTIASELKLPHAFEVKEPPAPDVTIVLDKVSSSLPGVGEQKTPVLQKNDQEALLDIPMIARFHIEQGGRITIEPQSDIDQDSIVLLLINNALRLLLDQRGYLVLNASVVRYDEDKAFLCMAPSGVGKSTLAALCHQQGLSVLSDHIAAIKFIDEKPRVYSGFAHIQLWQDIMKQLNYDYKQFKQARPGVNKYYLPIDLYEDELATITHVFFLSCDGTTMQNQESLKGVGLFRAFASSHTFASQQVPGKQFLFEPYTSFFKAIKGFQLYRNEKLPMGDALTTSIIRLCEAKEVA